MTEEKLKELLRELADAVAEGPPAGLGQRIRGQIPPRLLKHRIGWDTINIVIETRVSKLAVAAAITVGMILFAVVFGQASSMGDDVYEDGRLLIQYCLSGSGASRSSILANLSRLYEDMLEEGRDVVYLGQYADPADRNALLMYWKLADGRYMVVFNDLTARAVCPNALIRLQAWMLQKSGKK